MQTIRGLKPQFFFFYSFDGAPKAAPFQNCVLSNGQCKAAVPGAKAPNLGFLLILWRS